MNRFAAAVLATALLATAGPSFAAERYDSKRAGHPLRVIAYVLHPVGVALDYLIFYPAWVIGGHEPFRTLSGREAELPEQHEEVHLRDAELDVAPRR